MENQAISKDLSNSDMVVGPQTGNIAANIAAKNFQDPPNINERRSPLPLLENDCPQEQGSNLVENEEQHPTTNTSKKSTGKSAENAATTAATAPAAPAAAQSRKKPPPNAKASPRQRSLAKLHMNEPYFALGYDSDGEHGPFWGRTGVEGAQIFEEEQVHEAPNAAAHANPEANEEEAITAVEDTTTVPSPELGAQQTPLPQPQLDRQPCSWLKHELKLRCQPTAGNKKTLVDRLKKAIELKLPCYATLEIAKSKTTKKKRVVNGMKNFPETAFWKILEPQAVVVAEPENPTFRITRAPTISEKEAEYVPEKHNFAETFIVPEFKGVKTESVFDRRGNPRQQTKTVLRDQGTINTAFRDKHKLSYASKPWEVMNAFLPFRNDKSIKDSDSLSFEKMTNWTNTKAQMAGASSTIYLEFEPFKALELRQHFGLYVLQGLAPSPRIEYNFNSQYKDRIAGNDFVSQSFGKNAKRRHKHFKSFLACCNPL